MKIGDKIICIKPTSDFKKNKIYTIETIFKSLSHGELYISLCEVRYRETLYRMTNKILYENFSTLKDLRKEKLEKINKKFI